MTVLNLLVLRTQNIDLSRAFYETLGLCFVRKQHGSGPEHYSAIMGEMVIELYPGGAPAHGQRLGFQVEDMESILAALTPQSILAPATETDRGYAALLVDPDGRKVELLRADRPARDE